MAIAALIIAILALIASVASLSVQLTLAAVRAKELAQTKEAAPEPFLTTPTDKELESFFSPTNTKDQEKMNEIMENPDVSNYSGINEEFNV